MSVPTRRKRKKTVIQADFRRFQDEAASKPCIKVYLLQSRQALVAGPFAGVARQVVVDGFYGDSESLGRSDLVAVEVRQGLQQHFPFDHVQARADGKHKYTF